MCLDEFKISCGTKKIAVNFLIESFLPPESPFEIWVYGIFGRFDVFRA